MQITNISQNKVSVTENSDGGVDVTIDMPPVQELQTFSSVDQLREEKSVSDFVWISGGGAYRVNQQWVPLIRRSVRAPSNAGKLTIASGRAESISEIYDPVLIIRELVEEVVMIMDGRKILLPRLKAGIDSAWFNQCVESARPAIRDYWDLMFKPIPESEYCNAKLESKGFSDKLIVCSEGKEQSTSLGCVHINWQDLEVNLLRLVDLRFERPEKIVYIDSEIEVLQGVRRPINREIVFYNLLDGMIYDKIDGKESRPPTDLTAHAQELLVRSSLSAG